MYYGFEFGKVYGFDEKSDRDEWVNSNISSRFSVTHGVARKFATHNHNGCVFDYYDNSIVKRFKND